MADLNEDDIFKLIQLQMSILLLLGAFSSLSNIARATSAGKKQQQQKTSNDHLHWKTCWMMPFDDLSFQNIAPYMEQCTKQLCVCWQCVSADAGSMYLSLCLC